MPSIKQILTIAVIVLAVNFITNKVPAIKAIVG